MAQYPAVVATDPQWAQYAAMYGHGAAQQQYMSHACQAMAQAQASQQAHQQQQMMMMSAPGGPAMGGGPLQPRGASVSLPPVRRAGQNSVKIDTKAKNKAAPRKPGK